MIDMHCHTTYSDGTWSPTELLKKAEEKGIDILSITDHDSTLAYKELENIDIKKYYTGKLIVGAELNCVFNKVKIELLGYNFDREKLQNWLDELYGVERYRASMIKEFEDMCLICKNNNVKISDNLQYNPDKEYPIDVIYCDIKKYPENEAKIDSDAWESSNVFFRKCTTDKKFILYRDFTKSLPTAKEVSNKIRECGGKVFLAHLYTYALDNHLEYLKQLTNANIIDGAEVYYSKYNSKQLKDIEVFCEENNLYMSGGTDCHGEKNKDIELGTGYGNLQVNREEIEKWL